MGGHIWADDLPAAVLPLWISNSASLRDGLGLSLSPMLLKQKQLGQGKENKMQNVQLQSSVVPQ